MAHPEAQKDNPPTPTLKLKPAPLRGRGNWLMYKLFATGQDEKCAHFVEKHLEISKGWNEFPLLVKARIKRSEGQVEQALALFRAAVKVNPNNTEALKHTGKCLFLLGRHEEAQLVLEEAKKLSKSDWEVFHQLGMVELYLRQHEKALASFQQANDIERHVSTFVEMAKVHTLQGNIDSAIQVYEEALEFSPGHPEVLTSLGLLHLRLQHMGEASENLGNALTYDRRNVKAILAFASIQQQNGEIDAALSKYRVAFPQVPTNAELWNNVGMCFFEKAKYVASISCLKRALYSDPFKWHVALNLGLAFLQTKQYASAFLYLSAAVNLNPQNAITFMYLAIALFHLNDIPVCLSAYEKALKGDPQNLLVRLNFAITLANCGKEDQAKQEVAQFTKQWEGMKREEQNSMGDEFMLKASAVQERFK